MGCWPPFTYGCHPVNGLRYKRIIGFEVKWFSVVAAVSKLNFCRRLSQMFWLGGDEMHAEGGAIRGRHIATWQLFLPLFRSQMSWRSLFSQARCTTQLSREPQELCTAELDGRARHGQAGETIQLIPILSRVRASWGRKRESSQTRGGFCDVPFNGRHDQYWRHCVTGWMLIGSWRSVWVATTFYCLLLRHQLPEKSNRVPRIGVCRKN